jgi:GMP synthase (glutamine-hydrolysing)
MNTNKKGPILIVDAGGQYCHLIARRVREAGVRSIIRGESVRLDELNDAKGIIISGGPNSVYDPDAPKIPKAILQSKVPILGLCYGHQFLANELGGSVAPGKHREYGEATIEVVGPDTILSGLRTKEKVWMSHGDEVVSPPPGFQILARTTTCDVAAMADLKHAIFGLQFHPEVNETACGKKIIENFLFKICHCEMELKREDLVDVLRRQILAEAREKHVIFFVSGGVDSTVAFTLCSEVLGPDRVKGVFVDTGLMRKGEREEIVTTVAERGWHNMRTVDAADEFLQALREEANPEEKRHIIGNCFLNLQERLEAEVGLKNGSWLLGQGTIYPDTIESGGGKLSAIIKTHHNRVPAIQKMLADGLILEPLRDLYKDEVRDVGRRLGLPESLISKHPFPGPGLAVRCLCSENDQPVKKLSELSKIAKSSNLEAWAVPIHTVGVQGDYRTYSNLVILRGHADLETYAATARRITREIRDTNRVVFVVSPQEDFDLGTASVRKSFINKQRLDVLREADAICQKMLRERASPDLVWQFPVISLPLTLKGGETIALRPISSIDAMTAKHANLPLQFIRNMGKAVMQIPGTDMVLYDVTDKPPATIEWE